MVKLCRYSGNQCKFENADLKKKKKGRVTWKQNLPLFFMALYVPVLYLVFFEGHTGEGPFKFNWEQP